MTSLRARLLTLHLSENQRIDELSRSSLMPSTQINRSNSKDSVLLSKLMKSVQRMTMIRYKKSDPSESIKGGSLRNLKNKRKHSRKK